MQNPNTIFLSSTEAARFLGIRLSYLYKLVHEKRLPCYKPRAGALLFDAQELEAYVRTGRVSTQQELENRAEALLNRGRV